MQDLQGPGPDSNTGQTRAAVDGRVRSLDWEHAATAQRGQRGASEED